MKVTYTNNDDDLLAFQIFVQKRSGFARIIKAMWYIPIPLLLLAKALLAPAASMPFLFQRALNIMLAIIWLFIAAVLHKFIRRMSINAFKDSSFITEHTLEIGPEFLLESSSQEELRTRLDAMRGIHLEGDRAFVFVSDQSAHVIPMDRISEGCPKAFLAELEHRIKKVDS